MKYKLRCTFELEVELPDDHHNPKFELEERSCLGTGAIGAVLEEHMRKHEEANTCWACALGAKCELI